MELFQAKSYKDFIKSMIELHKNERGYQGTLAKAAGCQQAYLSSSLRTAAHLTPEHVHGLCVFWEFDEDQTEYLLALVQSERAGNSNLQAVFERIMERIREKRLSLSRVFEGMRPIAPEHLADYYGDWLHSCIHIATSIPNLQNPKNMAEHLGMPLPKILSILSKLHELGLVSREGEKYVIGQTYTHIGSTSPFYRLHHSGWQHRALADLNKKVPDTIHFSGIHSLSRGDYEKLRAAFIEILKNSQQIVAASPEEVLVCLIVDLFQVGVE